MSVKFILFHIRHKGTKSFKATDPGTRNAERGTQNVEHGTRNVQLFQTFYALQFASFENSV